jgi:hypothetical protein
MGFRGDGGAPPEKGSGGGGSDNDPMFSLYEEITKTNKDGEVKTYKKRVKTWFVKKKTKDKPVLMLDRASDERYATKIHEFKGPDGKLGSIVRCVGQAFPDKGCPFCEALEVLKDTTGDKYLKSKPSWVWCLTGIDRSKWTPTEGKNKGTTYTDFRRLVLITSQHYEDMATIEEKDEKNGWRGRLFDVSRSDEQMSYKAGTTWYPAGSMTEEEMTAEFKERAEDYGLTVEQFLEPFDYDKLIPAYTYEEAVQHAAKISGKAVEVPSGDTESISF